MPPPRRVSLPLLDARIDDRARATRERHPWWPCAAGCDDCCRALPTLPVIARDEWSRLTHAIHALPETTRAVVLAGIRARPHAAPVTCPILDVSTGRCLAYDARPIACRTYGFYTERDAGLHCGKVTRAVAEHGDEVVWGNGEAVARELDALGEARSLADWLAEDEGRNGSAG